MWKKAPLIIAYFNQKAIYSHSRAKFPLQNAYLRLLSEGPRIYDVAPKKNPKNDFQT